jgi:ribonuclease HI
LSDSPGYIVYTDGSAWTGDRIGAYAWVIVDEDGNEVIGGASETDTTISRMELMGAIDALESVRFVAGPCVVLVYSDSEYVVFGITDRSRKRNLNVDLWDKLDAAVDAHELVAFEHVYGHNGNYHNEVADKYASQLRREAQKRHARS